MGNSILTAKTIARQALIRLQNNQVLAGLVFPDYSTEFKQKGDTITVRKPAAFTAQDFSSTISIQDIKEASVDVKLDIQPDVSVEVTSKQMSLDIVSFEEQVIVGAVDAIIQRVEEGISNLYKNVPYFVGTSGSTPAALSSLTAVNKMLSDNKVPKSMRRLVLDTTAEAKLLELDSVVNAEKSGTTDALREASLGRLMSMDTFMSQNIKTHTAGTFTAVSAPKVNTTGVVDSNTLVLKGGSGTETIVAGDVFYITSGGVDYYYSAASGVAASGGVVSITTSNAVKVAHAVDDVVTFPDKTAGGHVANLAFHKNAFALVNAPLALPIGYSSDQAYIAMMPNGLSLRVVYGYDMTYKKFVMSFDTLFGVKVMYPELATRLLG